MKKALLSGTEKLESGVGETRRYSRSSLGSITVAVLKLQPRRINQDIWLVIGVLRPG